MATEQRSLFDGSDLITEAKHLAARSDPPTSKLAAAELVASGRHDAQKTAVLSALRAHCEPVTSAELAWSACLDRHTTARRLPDLERAGLVERGPARACRLTGHKAVTWRSRA